MSTKSIRSAEWASRQELLSIDLYAERPNRDKLTFLTSPRSGFSEVCSLSHNPSGTASSKPASNRGWLRR